MKPLYVQIIEDATGHCTLQMGPFPPRHAERVRKGAMINLNHDKFTVVTSEKEMEVHA